MSTLADIIYGILFIASITISIIIIVSIFFIWKHEIWKLIAWDLTIFTFGVVIAVSYAIIKDKIGID